MKHTIKTIVLLVGSLILYNSATASYWMLIDSNDEYSVYLDRESIKRENNTVKFWLKWEFKKTQLLMKIKYITMNQYYIIDCREKTSDSTNLVAYDSDGEVVFSKNYPIHMEPIVPDSISESWFKLLCK